MVGRSAMFMTRTIVRLQLKPKRPSWPQQLIVKRFSKKSLGKHFLLQTTKAVWTKWLKRTVHSLSSRCIERIAKKIGDGQENLIDASIFVMTQIGQSGDIQLIETKAVVSLISSVFKDFFILANGGPSSEFQEFECCSQAYREYACCCQLNTMEGKQETNSIAAKRRKRKKVRRKNKRSLRSSTFFKSSHALLSFEVILVTKT